MVSDLDAEPDPEPIDLSLSSLVSARQLLFVGANGAKIKIEPDFQQNKIFATFPNGVIREIGLTGTDIVGLLSTLIGNARLDASAIKNLPSGSGGSGGLENSKIIGIDFALSHEIPSPWISSGAEWNYDSFGKARIPNNQTSSFSSIPLGTGHHFVGCFQFSKTTNSSEVIIYISKSSSETLENSTLIGYIIFQDDGKTKVHKSIPNSIAIDENTQSDNYGNFVVEVSIGLLGQKTVNFSVKSNNRIIWEPNTLNFSNTEITDSDYLFLSWGGKGNSSRFYSAIVAEGIQINVSSPQGPPGPQGPQGIQGIQGETGPQGPQGTVTLDSARIFVVDTQTITIPSNIDFPIPFTQTRWDTNLLFDNTYPTRLTCKKAGRYSIGGNIILSANDTGIRIVYIRLNGGLMICHQGLPGEWIQDTRLNPCGIYQFSVGDYIELVVYQNSGTSLILLHETISRNEMWIQQIDNT